jgi:hypothetical protein
MYVKHNEKYIKKDLDINIFINKLELFIKDYNNIIKQINYIEDFKKK